MLTARNYILAIVLVVLGCVFIPYSYADRNVTHTHAEHVWGDDSTNTKVISRYDTLQMADSIIVIHTLCAPICSSHARVYNKEGDLIRVLKAPFQSVFPEAYIEENKVLWRDNDTLDYSPIP
jgi:hypothetical protein